MTSNTVGDLISIVKRDSLTLSYSGVFSDSMTDRIIELSEAYLESHEQMGKMRRKTSFLVAECFQNVVRHGVTEVNSNFFSLGTDSFVIRFKDNTCFIASENVLPNEQIDGLKSKMDQVNQYDKDELKSIYKQILEGGELSEKGGAGLGLIEMARKTENRLHYSFKSLDDNNSLFYLMLVLKHRGEEEQPPDYNPILGEMEEIIKDLRMGNKFLFFQGEFEQEIILPMIQMIEKNLEKQFDPHSTKHKLYHVAVEIMQNIGQHSEPVNGKHRGIIKVGKAEQGYIIDATNPVDKESQKFLDEMLSDLKTKNSEELDQIYRAKLRTSMKTDESSAGLGFIDLARITKKWDFGFKEHKTTSCFNYTVII